MTLSTALLELEEWRNAFRVLKKNYILKFYTQQNNEIQVKNRHFHKFEVLNYFSGNS